MQNKQQLEKFYIKKDPWGYKTNPEDLKRKNIILKNIQGQFKKVLDLGAGEGFITQDLPAKEIYGYEISDTASSRFPKNVKLIKDEYLKDEKFDLVIATGVLYKQYDYMKFLDLIMKHAIGLVLTCNIKNQEINDLPFLFKEFDFTYRTFVERLVLFDFSPNKLYQKSYG